MDTVVSANPSCSFVNSIAVVVVGNALINSTAYVVTCTSAGIRFDIGKAEIGKGIAN
jgi:hypothetical protein